MTAYDPSVGLEQKQILTQYTALLKTVAAQRPLLLILEDLHWVDATSNALLFHLSREVARDRILIVGSYRRGLIRWICRPPGICLKNCRRAISSTICSVASQDANRC